jgi:long-chain fatty acid transport protein
VYGLGSASAARAGAAAATASGFEALHYDPAGLADAPGPSVSLALHFHVSALRAGGTSAPLGQPAGWALGAVAPVPLGGWLEGRVTAGVLFYFLPKDLLVVTLRAPTDAFFPLLADTGGRAVAEPGLAVRLWDGLSVGAAIDAFAGLDGFVTSTEGATRAIDASVLVVTPAAGSLHAGARWHLPWWTPLTLAFSYRSAFRLPVRFDADTNVGGFPIVLDIVAFPFYTPETYTLGAALATEGLTLSVDGAYKRWSRLDSPFVAVDARFVANIALTGLPPSADFTDTVDVRAGVEARFRAGGAPGRPAALVAVRAGYALEPTPVPPQTGATNLLDSTHHVATAGAGVTFPRAAAGRPLTVAFHAGVLALPARTSTKDPARPCAEGGVCDSDSATAGFQSDNPGWPSLRAGGAVVFGGLTLEMGL